MTTEDSKMSAELSNEHAGSYDRVRKSTDYCEALVNECDREVKTFFKIVDASNKVTEVKAPLQKSSVNNTKPIKRSTIVEKSILWKDKVIDILSQQVEYEKGMGIAERYYKLERMLKLLTQQLSIVNSEGIPICDVELADKKLQMICSIIDDLDKELQPLIQKYKHWKESPKECSGQYKNLPNDIIVKRHIEHPSYRTLVRVEDFELSSGLKQARMAGDYLIVELHTGTAEEDFMSLVTTYCPSNGHYVLDCISSSDLLYKLAFSVTSPDCDYHCLLDLFDEVLTFCQRCLLVKDCYPDALVYCE